LSEPSISFLDMLAAGRQALGRYTGTVLAMFAAQLVLVLTAVFAMARVLASAFSTAPLFDRAVDGDLASWIYLLRNHREVFSAIGWLGGGAVLAWLAMSWFLSAGLIGVLADRPEGRAATARAFGASGASSFLPVLRLAVLGAPSYVVVAMALDLGLGAVAARLDYALSPTSLIGWLALGLAPALALLHVFWTIGDYARAELVMRRDSHGLTVLGAYARAIALVLKQPTTWLHAGLGWLLIAAVSIAYVLASHGQPMTGTQGAITLFIVRQGVALLRLALRVAMIAGQVALTRKRALPTVATGEPRRRLDAA
jgi:hypothetical protein